MVKKVTNEDIVMLLSEGVVKEQIQDRILLPQILVSGLKHDKVVEEILRCPYCGKEWQEEKPENKSYLAYGTIQKCPECEKKMFGRIPLQKEKRFEKSSVSYEISEFRVTESSKIFYADTALIHGEQGMIFAEYEIHLVYKVDPKMTMQEINLSLLHRAFVTERDKYLYNAAGKRTNKYLKNVFMQDRPMTIVSENAKNFMRNCLFMGGDHNCSESIWMDEFEKGRSVKDSYSYVPRGERKAGETLNQYHFKKVPEPPREYQKIVGKVLNEDLITGMKKRESLCMNCGRVFRDEVKYDWGEVVCPYCGCRSQYQKSLHGLNRKICFLSQEGENTLFIRTVGYQYSFGDEWEVSVEDREEYRCILTFGGEKGEEIHFLVNEGYATNPVWVEKEKYWSQKFRDRIEELSFIGEMPLLKYSALQEYLKQESPGTSYGALQLHSLITFIRFEKKYPVVEQICRRGIVSALAEELQYLSERNEFQRMDLTQQKVCNALKLSEHFTKMLIAHGGWRGTLIDLQRLYALDPNMRPEDYEWIVQHNIDIGSIERVFQETPMTIMRMCAYLENVRINQCFEPSMAINDWCDYLKAAKTIEVDLTDNKAKYPSSLKREHDRAMAKQKLVMDEKKDEFFQKETERYGKLFSYKTDGYLVMPPKNMKDLFEEGRKLCHCVGSYSDRIIQGQTCILFVRKAQEPEKPYFTIEVNPTDKCVVQLRGLSNRLVNQVTEKPLIDFLKEWGEKKHIQLKKAV